MKAIMKIKRILMNRLKISYKIGGKTKMKRNKSNKIKLLFSDLQSIIKE